MAQSPTHPWGQNDLKTYETLPTLHSPLFTGPGITAQNGFVVRLEGAGRCFGNWVIDQFAVYSDLTSAYVETDGSVIYQQLDTRNKIFDIAFLPNLD